MAAACQQYLTKYKEQNFHKFYIGEKWYLFSLKIERIQKSEFKASTNGIWYLPIRQTCKKETNVAMTSNKMFQVVWWSKILGFSSKELLRKKKNLNFLLSTTSTWHFPQIKKKSASWKVFWKFPMRLNFFYLCCIIKFYEAITDMDV